MNKLIVKFVNIERGGSPIVPLIFFPKLVQWFSDILEKYNLLKLNVCLRRHQTSSGKYIRRYCHSIPLHFNMRNMFPLNEWIRAMDPWNGFNYMAEIVRLQFIILRSEGNKNYHFEKKVERIDDMAVAQFPPNKSAVLLKNTYFIQ